MNKKLLLLAFFLTYYMLYSYEFYYFKSFKEHKSSVGCIAFSNDSKYLASGSFDTTIKIWDLNTNKSINTITHGAIVESLVFSRDNKLLVSVGRDKCIKIWNPKTGNLIQVFGPLNDFLFCAAFSPDNKNILIGSYKYIYFLDVKKNKIVNKIDIGNIWVRNIRFSPDNNYLGVCGGNEVIIYNVIHNTNFISKLFGKNIDLKKTSSHKTSSYVYSLDFSSDSQYFAFGNEQGDIYLYRTIDGFFMWSKKIYNFLIWSVSFSRYNILSVSGRDKDIVLLDIKNGNITNILPTTSDEIYSVAFSNNGKYLVSSGKDAKINIWKVRNINNFIFKKEYVYIIVILTIIFLIFRLFRKKSSVKNWKL